MALSDLLGRVTRETYDILGLFLGSGDARLRIGATIGGRTKLSLPVRASGDVTTGYFTPETLANCHCNRVGYSASPVQIVGDYYDDGPRLANEEFTADTDWTKGAGWAITGGAAVATAASASISQTAKLVIGQRYLVVFGLTNASGTVTPYCGTTAGTARGGTPGSNKVYAEILQCAGNTDFLLTGAALSGSIPFAMAIPVQPPQDVNQIDPTSYSRIVALCSAGALVDPSAAAQGIWALTYRA